MRSEDHEEDHVQIVTGESFVRDPATAMRQAERSPVVITDAQGRPRMLLSVPQGDIDDDA